jgi:hypothetical protein
MDVDCTSNVDASFAPGLTDTVVDTYDPCTSTDSTLKAGKRHLAYSPMDSCSPQVTTTTGTDEIVWNNGKVSTWEYTREVTESNGSVAIHQKGKITAGLFAGDSANEDLTVLLPGAYVHDGASRVPSGREDHADVPDRAPNDCATAEGGSGGGGPAERRLATGRLQIGKS